MIITICSTVTLSINTNGSSTNISISGDDGGDDNDIDVISGIRQDVHGYKGSMMWRVQ